ncbi:MAG: hypothetical protein ACLPXB_09205 [Thiobacillaceae bacterium]
MRTAMIAVGKMDGTRVRRLWRHGIDVVGYGRMASGGAESGGKAGWTSAPVGWFAMYLRVTRQHKEGWRFRQAPRTWSAGAAPSLENVA